MKESHSITIFQDLCQVSREINSFFHDEAKTTLWLNTENPLLGDVTPLSMILLGRTEKLQKHIQACFDGNRP